MVIVGYKCISILSLILLLFLINKTVNELSFTRQCVFEFVSLIKIKCSSLTQALDKPINQIDLVLFWSFKSSKKTNLLVDVKDSSLYLPYNLEFLKVLAFVLQDMPLFCIYCFFLATYFDSNKSLSPKIQMSTMNPQQINYGQSHIGDTHIVRQVNDFKNHCITTQNIYFIYIYIYIYVVI